MAHPPQDDDAADAASFQERFNDLKNTSLVDDTVAYDIFYIDDGLTENQTRSALADIKTAATRLVKEHLAEYIWQKDPFDLATTRDFGMSPRSIAVFKPMSSPLVTT